MSGAHQDEALLRRALKETLAAAEPADTPPFAHVWTRAAAGRRARAGNAGWRFAAAAAAVVAAVGAWQLVDARRSDPESVYRLALQVASPQAFRTPSDDWLAGMPQAPLADLPELPFVEFPLLPEETLL